MKRILAGLVVLVFVTQTQAEYRTVLVQVKKDNDKTVSVAIHSDEKKEQKSAASVDDAARVIGEMKGWGSQVGVYVTSDRAVPGADLKKLLAAINDNSWLELEYFGREVPKVVADHFLKAAQGPMLPARKPEELKEAVVGRWMSDDADRVAVEFGADGSIRLALYKRDWKWQMAKGTYEITDDGKVKYTAKLGGLAIRGHYAMKDGVLIGPSGSNSETRWKKAPNEQKSSDNAPATPRDPAEESLRTVRELVAALEGKRDSPKGVSRSERDPEDAFRKACELVAALEGKHDLLKGVSKVKATVERDEQKRLKSADLVFENNAAAPGKNDAKAKDASKPFFYVSVQIWSGRSQSPPANLHEFEWQGQTYQMWVRVFGSDVKLVKMVQKLVDEPLRGPLPPKVSSSGMWPGSRSSLQELAHGTATVLAALAKEKAEIHSRSAAHLSTQMTMGKGELIVGGGYVFFAQCRQKFQVAEILHGKDKPGDRVLEYGFVEKTEGFPLPGVQEPIPAGAKVILLMGEKGNILKALPDTPENRKSVRAVLSEQMGKNAEPILRLQASQPLLAFRNGQPLVFEGLAAVPIHRPGPEHFKIMRASDGKAISLRVDYDRAQLEKLRPNQVRGAGPAKDILVYNSLLKGTRLFLYTGIYAAKDAVNQAGILDLYGCPELEPGVRYRVTWACWPVGASKAVEVSCEFELSKDANKGGANILDGQWETVNVEREGQELGGGFRGFTMVIKGQTFDVVSESKRVAGGTIKLDAGKEPPTIDIIYTSGAGKGTTRLGVFTLQGDTLRIALVEVGAARPNEVGSKLGSGATLYEYRRKD